MIIVTVALHSARTGDVSTLGEMRIANVGGTHTHGDYAVDVMRKGTSAHLPGPITRTGKVEKYPRLAFNVWRLVARSLKAAFPEEDKAND